MIVWVVRHRVVERQDIILGIFSTSELAYERVVKHHEGSPDLKVDRREHEILVLSDLGLFVIDRWQMDK